MASFLDNAIYIANESTYATAITTGASFQQLESRGDGWERTVEYRESGGRWAGQQAMLTTRRVPISKGATGRIETVLMTSGMGRLLQHGLGSTAGPTGGTVSAKSVSAVAAATGTFAGKTVCTVAASHGFSVGMDATLAGAGALNGTYEVLATSSTTVTIDVDHSSVTLSTATLTGVQSYLLTMTTGTEGPEGSFTVLVSRVDRDGDAQWWQYAGCVATGWELTLDNGAEAMLAVDFVAARETRLTTAPSSLPTSAPAGGMFGYEDVAVTWDGSAADNVRSLTFTADLGLDTDRFLLDGTGERAEPVRARMPSYSGTLETEFNSNDPFDDFVSGATVDLSTRLTFPDNISSSIPVKPYFELLLPNVQYTGSTPVGTLDDLTMQSLPYMALDDPSTSGAVATLRIKSADSAV